MQEKDLIPVLERIQKKYGYLPLQALKSVARELGVPAVQVYGAATFFKQFRLNPPGKYQIEVCMGTACYMAGGQVALDSFERRLKIGVGKTTPDGEFSLERVACVGCCNLAPVAVVDSVVEKNVTPTRVDGILLSLGLSEENKENKENSNAQGK